MSKWKNGCQAFWGTYQRQVWRRHLLAWHGHGPLRLFRSREGLRDLVAMDTQEGVKTTLTTPSWREWVVHWEPAKYRTSATVSISSSVRTAGKNHPPLILEALIVLDDLWNTYSKSISIAIYFSFNVLIVGFAFGWSRQVSLTYLRSLLVLLLILDGWILKCNFKSTMDQINSKDQLSPSSEKVDVKTWWILQREYLTEAKTLIGTFYFG